MNRLDIFRKTTVWIIFGMLMMISFGVLNVAASPSEVWVSPEFDEETQGWGETHFANIQEALRSVSEGGLVIVGSGTYNEHIIVDKSVTIRAEDIDEAPIIDGGGTGTILFLDSSDVSIENLKIQNGEWGIWIASNNNTVRDSTIRDCEWRMVIPGYGNEIISNRLEGQCEGMMVSGSKNVISDNIVLGDYPIGGCTGLRLAFSSHNIVRNNYFENYRCHILITGADHNIVAGNTLYRSWDHVELSEEYRNAGMILFNSQKNTIINNDISNISGSGIRLFGRSTENLMQANKMEDVGRSGFEILFGSDRNEVINNELVESTRGVILDQVDDNLLYNNIILDLGSEPFDNGANHWVYEGTGNYWGEYREDEIVIPPNGEDDSPLEEKPEISKVEEPEIDYVIPRIEFIESLIIEDTQVWEEDLVIDQPIKIREGGELEIRDIKVEVMDLIEVEEGGSLVLRNVDISVLNQDLMNLIIVHDEGTLEIYDSKLSARGQDIMIREGGSLRVEESQLIGMGHWDGGAALDLRNDGAVIVNNTIKDGFVGILIENSNDHTIINNEISNSATGILLFEISEGDTIIRENKFSNMIYAGMFIQSHPHYTLENNSYVNIWGNDICGWGVGLLEDDTYPGEREDDTSEDDTDLEEDDDDTDQVKDQDDTYGDTHTDYGGFVLLIIIFISAISLGFYVRKKKR